MRNRSHRLPISDPLDDWVDGSWTVDCVCGVNFDDGEEMVNCDECGVWVHTRCSRYVKSEKLFACDKCKSKSSRNDSEETEVAQLLVELPTKTLRMENPNPSCGREPPRRPFRLWTDIPMEERVHVQGVPGGDTALFGGLSSVFGPELWKCTGHVPKKFNFQYREFPCWDEKEDNKRTDEEHGKSANGTDLENENPANKGAGVLFSLSKDNGLPTTQLATLVGMKRQAGDGGCDRLTHSNGTKKQEGNELNIRRPHNGVKKDKSLPHSIVIHSGKRKKENLGTSKDQTGKKKARSVDKDSDSKKRRHASKSVPTLSSDAKQLEFYEDRGPKVVKTVAQSSKHGNSRDTVPADSLSDSYWVVEKDAGAPEKSLAFSGRPSEILSIDISRYNSSTEARPKEENAGHQVPARLEISPKTDDCVAPLLEHNDSGSVPIKEEVVGNELDNLNENRGGSGRSEGVDPHKSESLTVDLGTAAPEVKDNIKSQDTNGDMSPNSLHPSLELKTVVDIGNSEVVSSVQSTLPGDVKMDNTESLVPDPQICADHLSENIKVIDSALDSSKSSEHSVQVGDKDTVAGDCQTDKADELVGPESSLAVQKSSSELKNGSRLAEEPSKSGSTNIGPSAPPSQRKMVISVGKSSSTSSTAVISKPSVSDSRRPANPKSKKDNSSNDVLKNDDRRERSKKVAKEHIKSSSSSVLKASHSSKVPHSSVSKRTLTNSKEPLVYSSSKTSSLQNILPTPEPGESPSSLQTESGLHVQNKVTASGLPQRGGKMNHSNSQPSTKANHTPTMHPPPAPLNSHANLSDEELALLLHQELNSSPRVPRVPRMRNSGSLPQLASPTTTSTLMKRTSSSGAKDHALVSRRKGKDLAKEGSRNSREVDDEAKKADRVTSSSDQSKHNLACTADPNTKGESENGSVKGSPSAIKSIPPASTTTASSGPSSSTEANEQNMSSTRNSPRNMSDDDTGTVGRPTNRTLPGLIADIMSKGKRMTYEELCNAVLPHWPNLRKHNGERYAYSSHSQAVLDCLRNRSEWARLVDRGPKTNASRKRRKSEAEHSEDNEYTIGKDVESHRDEFPKRKRSKATKRRRLALQGRGIKDVRRRHNKAEVVSDDDDDDDDIDDSSNSTEETAFSEDDDIEGGGGGGVEASASSDETENML